MNNFKYFTFCCLFTISSLLLSSNIAQARRSRSIEIKYDQEGTAVHYETYQNTRRIISVMDRNRNLLEEYFYEKEFLQSVKIRNIKTGDWISLEFIGIRTEGRYFNVVVDGKSIGIWSYIIPNSRDVVKITMDIDESDMQSNGIGTSVANWIVKQVFELHNISEVQLLTTNPIVVNLAMRITDSQIIIFTDEDGKSYILQTNNFMDLLIRYGSFHIDHVGGAETFDTPGAMIVVGPETIVSSQWLNLPPKTTLERVDVLPNWIVTLDGAMIGQVKMLSRPLRLVGTINPIRIYIDVDGNIVSYNLPSKDK